MLTIPLDQFTADEIMGLAYEALQAREIVLRNKISDLRAQLGGSPVASPVVNERLEQPRKRRVLSVAARKRIAAAQKKRWAVFHKARAASE